MNMKSLYSILLAIMIYVPASAQKAILRFEGSANSNNTTVPNYMVDLDGKKYYSSNADLTANGGASQIEVNQLAYGAHKIAVYETEGNATINTSTANPIYSNNFQLRSGYDMVIAIRRNGQVSFSEKRITQNSTANSKTPMTDSEFDKQMASINGKWSQTSKYNAVKSAISNKSNYFTTDQVGQLLLLLTSETRRLELAKLSYPKITDPSNFADVSELFKTQANKDNIDKFIQSKNITTTTSTDIDNARPPLTTQRFNQLKRQISNQYQETGKIAVLRDAFNVTTNYFTTAQLKELLLLISNENERLALAKQSYPRVSDQTNFTSLSTIFTVQTNRDDFNNYVKNGETVSTTPNTRTAMSDGDFSKLQMKARLHFRESSTVKEITTAFNNTSNYFTVDQIRSLLSMVSAESDRLALAKLAYLRIVDPSTFQQLYDMFSQQSSIDALNTYIKATALR